MTTLTVNLTHFLGKRTQKYWERVTDFLQNGHSICCVFLLLFSLVFNPVFYCPKLISIANHGSIDQNIRLESGIYCWTLGPSYETAEEIKLFRALNGSAVGMSTVPEIEMGVKCGLEMLTISTLTNYAAGISKKPLSHNEVIINDEKSKRNFINLLKNILKRI